MRNLIVSLTFTLAAARADATTLVPADIGVLAHDALAIARGRVVAAEGRWTDDRRTIETIVTLQVETYLKGDLGVTVQFLVPGGRLGRYRSVFVGAPEFNLDDRVVVFLGAHGPSMPYLVGFSQGVYRVVRSAGADVVTPPPVWPTATGTAVVRGDPARTTPPLADFEQRVHALATAAR
ncbi:MAG TPA: hypothetical protein VFA59_14450 [Vicinamibacterales bacterium]|nr:hypothetical protein [Vicinamibacterales bacterium]